MAIFNLPEIINGVWSGRMVDYTVPDRCLQCGTLRTWVKNFSTVTYGTIKRAKCGKPGCSGETYEELRIAAGSNNKNPTTTSSKPATVIKDIDRAIPLSFFKPKMDPWKPDTRVGAGFTSNDGMICCNSSCKEFVPFAQPNQPDKKTFICRKCRVRI